MTTPGPWEPVAVATGVKRRNLVYVKIQAARTVGYAAVTHGAADEGEVGGAYAEHPTLSRGRRVRGVTISEAEALENGRLMAAAPDLLAACEDAVEELRTDENYVGDNGGEADFLVALRAAIAKARGT